MYKILDGPQVLLSALPRQHQRNRNPNMTFSCAVGYPEMMKLLSPKPARNTCI